MPTMTAILQGNVTPFTNAMQSAQKVASRASAGIVWELAVIAREVARGNWTRLAGSLSILFQRMGMLSALLNPVTALLAALGAAAYKVSMYFKYVADGESRLAQITGGVAHQFEELSQEMDKAARSAQRFHDWLSHIGPQQETLNETVREHLRLMDREFELQQRQARERGQSPAQRAQAEIQHGQERVAFLQSSLAAAEKEMWQRADEAQAAGAKENDPALKARLDDLRRRKAEAASVVDETRQAYIAKFGRIPSDPYAILDIPVQTKNFGMQNLPEVTSTYNALAAQAAPYETRAQANEDAVARAKTKAEQALSTYEALKRETREAESDLALEQQYPESGRARLLHGSINSAQAVGAYASPAGIAMLDVARKSERHLANIEKDLKSRNGGAGGGDYLKDRTGGSF